MTEAVRCMLDFGFTAMGLNRIEAEVMPENSASAQLLYKLGFRAEGIRRECGFWNGVFHDLTMFALLKREYASHLKP